MNLKDKILVGLASSSIIFFQVQAAIAQSVSIQNTREFSVNINIDDGYVKTPYATGVIVTKNGNTYYVLTASHVINPLDNNSNTKFFFIAQNGDILVLTIKNRTPQKGITDIADIAELSFTSQQNYTPAVIGNPMALIQNSPIYVAGWPNSGKTRGEMEFSPGNLIEIINNPGGSTGQLLIYNNKVEQGLSGGPVLNQAGQLVGIHTGWYQTAGGNGKGISIATIREVVVVPEIKTALGRTPSAPNIANQPPSSPNQPPANPNQPPVVVRQPPANPNQPPVVVSQPPTNEPVPNFSIVIKGSLW
jgi:S1-C subfamily serine protease